MLILPQKRTTNKNSTTAVRTAYLHCMDGAFQGISRVKLPYYWQNLNQNTLLKQTCYFLVSGTPIECFHMTSRRPYWCPETMKWRPCWCPKRVLWELNSFLMQTLSFVSINLHRCWPREWKHYWFHLIMNKNIITTLTSLGFRQ